MAKRLFELSKAFPKEETYSLTDQGRRASRSIGAQIAEAWGKRRYERHFVSKLTDADAEQLETQHWVETAFDCSYLSEDTRDALCCDLREIGRMLESMIEKAPSFCNSSGGAVREDSADYFTGSEEERVASSQWPVASSQWPSCLLPVKTLAVDSLLSKTGHFPQLATSLSPAAPPRSPPLLPLNGRGAPSPFALRSSRKSEVWR